MKSVPPLDEVFAMAGMQLPTLLGQKVAEPTADPVAEEPEIEKVEAEPVVKEEATNE